MGMEMMVIIQSEMIENILKVFLAHSKVELSNTYHTDRKKNSDIILKINLKSLTNWRLFQLCKGLFCNKFILILYR